MDEGRLERVVLDFADREYDVLVCTTIIESGLDMPTVNTMVVDRADLLGLAQLYQLRGRVGRRGQRAYAYLLHPQDRALTEEAYERLKAIGEFTDLGSGFKLAMRDLEIRGAGNLLGGAQSGHIAAVGFDLYCELVTEAVGELKGEKPVEPFEVVLDLPIDAHLPREYVAPRRRAHGGVPPARRGRRPGRRRGHPRRVAGPLRPDPASRPRRCSRVARLRAECVRVRATSVSVQKGVARIDGLELPESRKVRLKRLVPRAVAKDGGELAIPLRGPAARGRRRARRPAASARRLTRAGVRGAPRSTPRSSGAPTNGGARGRLRERRGGSGACGSELRRRGDASSSPRTRRARRR